MMRRLTVATLATLALTAPGAMAGAFAHNPDGTPAVRFNNWIRTARMPQPDADVTVIEQDDVQSTCGEDALGCHLASAHGSTIWLKRSLLERSNFLHELGHVFDHAMLTDVQRRRFQHIDESTDRQWHDVTLDWLQRPSEHFAMAYATCAKLGVKLGKRNTDGNLVWDEQTQYLASVQQYRQTCRLIERASLGTGLLDYTPRPA